jgi:predicted nucleic acid-binding protein
MNGKRVFVDTNIIVYAHDADAGEKHLAAKELLLRLWDGNILPSISIQVLQELYVTLRKRGVTTNDAQAIVSDYLEWDVVENNRTIFTDALVLKTKYKISFWDASIIAAAHKADATILFSEDLSDGQKYGSVTVINPFRMKK